MVGMRLSALRFPLGRRRFLKRGAAKLGRGRYRVARTIFHVVIAGLDPAIHRERWLAAIRRVV
jgi:hypothetical protein